MLRPHLENILKPQRPISFINRPLGCHYVQPHAGICNIQQPAHMLSSKAGGGIRYGHPAASSHGKHWAARVGSWSPVHSSAAGWRCEGCHYQGRYVFWEVSGANPGLRRAEPRDQSPVKSHHRRGSMIHVSGRPVNPCIKQ